MNHCGPAPLLLAGLTLGAPAKIARGIWVADWGDGGGEFAARPGVWIGAKVGLFAIVPVGAARGGHADWSWFRVEPPSSRP